MLAYSGILDDTTHHEQPVVNGTSSAEDEVFNELVEQIETLQDTVCCFDSGYLPNAQSMLGVCRRPK